MRGRQFADELLRHWATLTPEGRDGLLNVLSEELPRCTTFPPLLCRALLTGDEEVLAVVESRAGLFSTIQLQELGSLVATGRVALAVAVSRSRQTATYRPVPGGLGATRAGLRCLPMGFGAD